MVLWDSKELLVPERWVAEVKGHPIEVYSVGVLNDELLPQSVVLPKMSIQDFSDFLDSQKSMRQRLEAAPVGSVYTLESVDHELRTRQAYIKKEDGFWHRDYGFWYRN